MILALDMAGLPNRWLMVEEAITYHARRMVAWSLGEVVATYHGGISRLTGERSSLSTASIIAIKGAAELVRGTHLEPQLTNAALFRRDRHVCAYCGGAYRERELSRDHVVPVHRGGKNRWMNVVTACRVCNISKGGRTPEDARMPLLYAPYVPNRYEHLILQNRRILEDQMEYLLAKVPRYSRLFV
ncbi:MAG: HNH endonuclease [Betaproteobacteria bacterium]|nr:HNH endonuclease [Betaproteobacteria bacterium]